MDAIFSHFFMFFNAHKWLKYVIFDHLWNFIGTLPEFYWYPSGILLVPFWNFIGALPEFYWYLSGILLVPLILADRMITGFAAPHNQVYNQVLNQVYNQAINQGAIDGLIYHFICG